MEYFDFNKALKSSDAVYLLQSAGNCHSSQQHLEEEIAELKERLREQQSFEVKLRERADSLSV